MAREKFAKVKRRLNEYHPIRSDTALKTTLSKLRTRNTLQSPPVKTPSRNSTFPPGFLPPMHITLIVLTVTALWLGAKATQYLQSRDYWTFTSDSQLFSIGS